MNYLAGSGIILAASVEGSAIKAVLLVILYWAMFNVVESSIEKLIFGERFIHFLDPVFACMFIAYSGYAVWHCALYNNGSNGV